MRNLYLLILILVLSGVFLNGCVDYNEHEKFIRPDWVGDKLYTQVTAEEDLTRFAECLRILGLDTILNVSGSFTIFAPSDDAVNRFLVENQYSSIADIPKDKLEEIVEFHIIQNPWTLLQLRQLNVHGWIDPLNPWSVPNAYKRQTLLKNPDEKYWIKRDRNGDIILMDSTIADDYKKVFVQSRKYVPIYFDEFFDIAGLSPEDYGFYFDRPYIAGNVYYAEAMVTRPDIYCENGFIHVVDRVVKPMLNAKELLERELPGESYKQFLELVYRYYPGFSFNEGATENQPAFKQGRVFDTLWDLNFNDLAFDIHEELWGNLEYIDQRYTMANHNGMHIPTDEAFGNFVNGILTAESGFPHWKDLDAVPEDIIDEIVLHHFFYDALYYTTIQRGFRDGQRHRFYLDEQEIIRKEFGSNCTFLGLNEYHVPRLFTSVTGPVFLRPAFSRFRSAMQYTSADRDISWPGREYSFFPISDGALRDELSLMIEGENNFYAYDWDMKVYVDISRWELEDKILNQVGWTVPDGSANKEFIRTLRGNYIIWNNENNTVRGSKPTKFGYNGDRIITCNPVPLEEPTDNGRAWWVNSWFNFVNTGMLTALAKYPVFFDLLRQAGLFDESYYRFPFLQDHRYFTIFIPSAQAMNDYRADTLPEKELANFLKYHFVKETLIFTDNKMPSDQYYTLGKEEGLTPYYSYPAIMQIRPGPDLIEILDSDGNPYVVIPEAEGITNIMVTTDDEVTAVIHEINRVLVQQN
jgi:uncharacterized surface protein with fasciclin (FAS1) repeats